MYVGVSINHQTLNKQAASQQLLVVLASSTSIEHIPHPTEILSQTRSCPDTCILIPSSTATGVAIIAMEMHSHASLSSVSRLQAKALRTGSEVRAVHESTQVSRDSNE
jgi:hypothetical protein